MKAFLLFINLLLLLNMVPCKAQGPIGESTKEYNLFMQVRGQEITGLCIMNLSEEDGIVGTIVNEFGVKAFDFIYQQNKVRILNIIAPLDKWYIRKILRKDFLFILSNLRNIETKKEITQNKRIMKLSDNDEIHIINQRYNIRYIFSQMEEK